VQFALTVPTVADRCAQEVVRRYLEPILEAVFHPDSYGYRPGKSAIEAVRQARQRCWRYDWVLDLDVKGYLDHASYCTLVYEAWLKRSGCDSSA
jgi:RNA-directed DNA polymerase